MAKSSGGGGRGTVGRIRRGQIFETTDPVRAMMVGQVIRREKNLTIFKPLNVRVGSFADVAEMIMPSSTKARPLTEAGRNQVKRIRGLTI